MNLAENLLLDLETDRANPLNRMIQHCPFCADVITSDDSSRAAWNTVLLETENFVATPSVGSLVEGWVLLLPKKHMLCMGSLDAGLRSELKGLKDALADIISTEFSIKPTIFEHGPARPKSGHGCGIDHAHLHLVPLGFSLSESAHARHLHWELIDRDLSHLSSIHQAGNEYLLLWEPDLEPIASTTSGVPSQFFRRLIAETLNLHDHFDYKNHAFPENAERTAERLGHCLTI